MSDWVEETVNCGIPQFILNRLHDGLEHFDNALYRDCGDEDITIFLDVHDDYQELLPVAHAWHDYRHWHILIRQGPETDAVWKYDFAVYLEVVK